MFPAEVRSKGCTGRGSNYAIFSGTILLLAGYHTLDNVAFSVFIIRCTIGPWERAVTLIFRLFFAFGCNLRTLKQTRFCQPLQFQPLRLVAKKLHRPAEFL